MFSSWFWALYVFHSVALWSKWTVTKEARSNGMAAVRMGNGVKELRSSCTERLFPIFKSRSPGSANLQTHDRRAHNDDTMALQWFLRNFACWLWNANTKHCPLSFCQKLQGFAVTSHLVTLEFRNRRCIIRCMIWHKVICVHRLTQDVSEMFRWC